jgi:glycosyltransferase involved in cell wall biosynthesis
MLGTLHTPNFNAPLNISYFSDPNKIHIFIVGRMSFDKGFEIILDILNHFLGKNNKLVFHFFGNGEYFQIINKRFQQFLFKNLFLHGYVNELKNFYSQCNLYLSCSLHENFSLALIEALSYGVPAIVSNVGDNRLIIKNYQNGMLVESFLSKEFIDSIDKIIDINLNELSIKTRSWYLNYFTNNEFDIKLETIYNLTYGNKKQ